MTLSSKRNQSMDILKGWLIVFVIVGHVVLGTTENNIVRYVIYSFHMPLFIAVAGYLLNQHFIKLTPIVLIFFRYWWRLILPFAPAFIFFTGILFVHAVMEGRLSLQLLLSYVYTPYYHLWFIPTMILWVLILAFMIKIKVRILAAWFVCALLSLYWAAVPEQDHFFPLSVLLSKKLIYFFSFFFAWLSCSQPSSSYFCFYPSIAFCLDGLSHIGNDRGRFLFPSFWQ